MTLSHLWLAVLRWVFVACLVVVLPLAERALMRRLQRFSSESARLRFVRRGIIGSWIAAGLAVALARPASVADLGALGTTLVASPGLRAAALAGVLALLALPVAVGLRAASRPEARRRVARASGAMRAMMPVSGCERAWWAAASVTAGVCEEIFARGFLLQFFGGGLAGGLALPALAACILGAAVFGIEHAYQGGEGIVRSGLIGLLLGLCALLSGGLALPIAIHVLLDLQLLWVYRPLQDDPAGATRLIAGCDARDPVFSAA